MKQNKTTPLTKFQTWFMLLVAILMFGQTSKAEVVYNNSVNRMTNGSGDALVFTQSGYEYGDEVVLGGAGRYLTNFQLEYYQAGIPAGATMRVRIYANDGSAYGTNFNAPGSMLFDSQAFTVGSNGDGFHTLTFDRANSGFGVPVGNSFTWTVEFGGVTSGSAALSLYDAPTIGSDYSEYWENSGTVAAPWVYRTGSGSSLVVNFGAQAEAQTVTDTTIPTISFSAPVDKFLQDTNSTLTVTGSAKDGSAGRVSLVLVKATQSPNSKNYAPATLSAGSAGATNWAISLPLYVGTNLAIAKAVDWAGNIGTNKRTFVYQVLKPFAVSIKMDGIASSLGGLVKASGVTTSNSFSTNLMIGRLYSIELKASTKHYLSNSILTVSGSNSVTYPRTSLKYSFTMQTNYGLTVNYATNRYYSVRGGSDKGIYNGLFGASDTNDSTSGFITFKISPADTKNTFSGKIATAGEEVSVAGTFDLDGDSVGDLSKYSFQLSNRYVVRLHIPFDGSDEISGSVSNVVTGLVSTLTADLNTWYSNGVSQNLATNYTGNYCVAFPSDSSSGTPSGYGSLNFAVKAFGKIDTGAAGVLADGSKVKQYGTDTYLSKSGKWPMYMRALPDTNVLNKVTTVSAIGWLQFAGADGGISGNAKLIHKPNTGLSYYAAGYTNISDVIAEEFIPLGKDGGGKYTNRSVELGLLGAGALNLSEGNLVSPLAISTISYTNATFSTFPKTGTKGPYESEIKVGVAGGAFSGGFLHPVTSTKVKFIGVGLPGANRIYGMFLGSSEGGKVVVAP